MWLGGLTLRSYGVPVVSRAEGYRRAAGKERLALAVVAEFFRVVIGVEFEVIADQDENYRLGDFRSAAGVTMECKGQPIDPFRYRQNFVEVFEKTDRPDHAQGFSEAAHLLGLTPQQLAEVRVTQRDGTKVTLDRLPCLSASVHSLFTAPLTTYVNYQNGGKWIYLYDRQELTSHIKKAVRRGLRRGIGNSNEDTFSVFVPISSKRWQRVNGAWQWVGGGTSERAVAHLRAVLNGHIATL
jgi:hypothetical protein